MAQKPNLVVVSGPGSPRSISRREFLRIAGVTTLGLLAAGCAPKAEAPVATEEEPEIGGQINIITWEGYENPDAFQSFYDEYGVTPNTTYIGSNDEVPTKYKAGGPGTYDVSCLNNRYFQLMAEEEMIIPLDLSRIPNWEDLYAAFQDVPYAYYEGELYCLPAFFGFDVINYNADLTDAPDSWFFHRDPAFEGKWGLLDNPAGTMMLWGTMLGHGADASQYTQDNLTEIVELGKEVVASAKTIVKSFGELKDLLVRGDIVAGYTGWEAVTAWGREEGANLAHVLPPEASKCWSDNYCIFNGAPNLDTAYAWVNHAISAEAMAIMGPAVSSMVGNSKAPALMSEEDREAMGYDGVDEKLGNAAWSKFPPKEAEDPYINMDELYEGYEKVVAG